MPFPTALADDTVDSLATIQLGTDCYLLVWQQNVIFKALINQASFETSFATITFDTVTTGAYTDVLEGYTVWLSLTDNIRAAAWWGRLRSAATATALSVEWNSFVPANNYFIFVTKDVRESTKTPFRNSDGTWRADYDITYHAPPPIIYDIPTVFFAQIAADGNADITIEPNAYAITSGATISSWALTTTDGGSQVSFDGASGDAVIRYTTPGNYMPRLTVTDSAGNTQWFTPFVVVEDANLSSVVNLDFENIAIEADVQGGWNMSMPFSDGVANVLDGTMCALYMPHATAGNKVLFCGRARTEDSDYTADGSGTATFNVDGLANIMNNLNVISWRYKDNASPDDFTEVTSLTPWRAIGTYIREMTNINNTHSLQLADVTDDYVYISYFFQKGTLLDSLRNQMWSINMDFDFTSDGMFKLVRNLRFQTEAERAALTNVANFQFKHYSGDSKEDIMYSLEKDHSFQVGKAIAGCGWYNTTSASVTFFAALTPPVHPARGTEQAVTDRQILKADLTRAAAETEGKRRARNDFAAKQNLDTLGNARLAGAFIGKMNPSVSDWYSNTLTVDDGIRRITYTASDRWLLTGLSLAYNNASGQIEIDPTWQIESDDLGFAASIRNPLPLTFYDVPVMMPQPAFPGLNYDPGIDFPTGADKDDEQPVKKEDTDPVAGAQDPATMVTLNNSTVVVWSETRAQMTRNAGPAATWFDVTPGDLPSGHKIQEFVWDRFSDSGEGGYVIAHNDTIATPDTRVYHNKGVGSLAFWQETTLTDMLATQVRATSKDAVIVYGKFETFAPAGGFPVTLLNGGGVDWTGDGIADLVGSSTASSHTPPVISAVGIYDPTLDRFLGQDSGNNRPACDTGLPVPPGLTLSAISMDIFRTQAVSASADERVQAISLDGALLAEGTIVGPVLTVTVPGGSFPITDANMLQFHGSSNLRMDAGNNVYITEITINATAAADYSGTRYSTDAGENFDSAISIGEMALNGGSMDMRYGGQVFATKDEQVRAAALPGTGFLFDADQGDTVGLFAQCLRKVAKNDYLLALDSLDGDTGLYKIINDVRTDITPDIAGVYGLGVGIGSLANSPVDTAYTYALMAFGGATSLAYSDDLGATWAINTDPTNNAKWVDINPRSTKTVYIADGATVLQSTDGGINLTSYPSPIASLTGIAVL